MDDAPIRRKSEVSASVNWSIRILSKCNGHDPFKKDMFPTTPHGGNLHGQLLATFGKAFA